MRYIQGFIVPVPKAKKEAYIKLAAASGPIFQEYGAVRIVESWSENTPDGKVTDFKKAVKAESELKPLFSPGLNGLTKRHVTPPLKRWKATQDGRRWAICLSMVSA